VAQSPAAEWDDGRVLDELAAIGPFFAVAAHPPGAAPALPWRPASELTTPSRALRERIASVRAMLASRGGVAVAQVEPRVAASAVHLGLAARLAAPALGAAALRRPLDPRPGGLWWQDAPGGPVPLSVPLPSRPPLGPGDSPGPPGEWDLLLLDELLAPLTAAVARLVPVSRRVLWGNVASAVNAAAAQVARQRPDLAAAAWQAAARLFARPHLRDERDPPGPAFRRSSCCLFYRLAPGTPSAVCGDCVLAGRANSA
jgi:Ferric iron reductase FhuF-like transporter/FhuF 2Fe-2S C-terminal domain